MVLYQCKNGPNKGRLFWRSPYWRSAHTRDLFICDKDVVEKSGTKDVAITNTELEVMASVGYMKFLYEDSRKKNKNLKTKLKTENFHEILKMFCLVVSF